MTIEKTHRGQSNLNLALLNLVEQQGQVSYATLFDRFGDMQVNEVNAHKRFSKKMEYLCFTQQLSSTGRGHDRVFSLGPEAGKSGRSTRWMDRPTRKPRKPKAAPERTAAEATPTEDSPLAICLRAAEARDAPAFALSPSRLTVTVLPTRSPALRQGALDFKSVASRGFAC